LIRGVLCSGYSYSFLDGDGYDSSGDNQYDGGGNEDDVVVMMTLVMTMVAEV